MKCTERRIPPLARRHSAGAGSTEGTDAGSASGSISMIFFGSPISIEALLRAHQPPPQSESRPSYFAYSVRPHACRTRATRATLSRPEYELGFESHLEGPWSGIPFATPVMLLYVKLMFAHPSVKATRTRPCLSSAASLKSRRFRQAFDPPPFQMQPR